MNAPKKIVRFEAENFKRLKAVEITPDNELVIVTGRNAQGKTSVLDGIEVALGGMRRAPSRPIRDGEEEARLVAELDNGLRITRRFAADGKSSLVVETAEGARVKRPQGVLDALVGSLAFDPLDFLRLVQRDPKKALEVVREAAGVDLAPLEGERARLFEERTGVNRDVSRLEGQLAGIPQVEAPAELLSVAAIGAELEAAQAKHAKRAELERNLDRHGAEVAAAERKAEVLGEQIRGLKRQLAELERQQREATIEAKELADVHRLASEALEAFEPPPDLAPIRARLDEVEDVNARVRQNARRAEVEAELEERRKTAATLTQSIADVDAKKAAAIAGAELPVEGLSWTDEGVTLSGLPFDQASSAEQLRASVGLAIAQHPKLRVLLVREGSLLDREGLRLLAELAAAHDCQVWIEVVGDGPAGILIEDGTVKGAADATEAAE